MSHSTEKSSKSINTERRAQIGNEKRARTRSKILDTAFNLIGREKGRFIMVEEVCQEAKISRGTFYNYFTSIEELVEALCYELSHDFNTSVLTIVNNMANDAEKVSAAVRYYLDKAQKDKRWGWAMVNISTSGYIFGIETYRQAEASIAGGIDAKYFSISNIDLGRDILLGTTFAAMITILNGGTDIDYSKNVSLQILLGLGVDLNMAHKTINYPLEDPLLF